MKLAGTTALVTGATGGLGAAIARRLKREGVQLVLSGRRAGVLEELGNELGSRTIICDLANREDVERLAQETLDVDILIANAGVPASGTMVDDIDIRQIDRSIDVNLRAPMVLAKLLGDKMVARRNGHMVFMSSLAGKIATPGSSTYCATKFGLRGFALALREDLYPYNVGVSCICPGFIRDAGMFHDSGAHASKAIGTNTPEEVANAVVKAIEHNRAEVSIGSVFARAGSVLGSVIPGPVGRAQRKLGAAETAREIAAGQVDKRK